LKLHRKINRSHKPCILCIDEGFAADQVCDATKDDNRYTDWVIIPLPTGQ